MFPCLNFLKRTIPDLFSTTEHSKIVVKTILQLMYTNIMNHPNFSAKFRQTDMIPNFYFAGLKYGHIKEIWPT